MNKTVLSLCAALACSAPAMLSAEPGDLTAVPAPPPKSFEDWVKQVKNPADWFAWGGDLRLRNEYFNNAISLNQGAVRHEQDYFRLRERLWASLRPLTNMSVNARVAAEELDWMNASFRKQYGNRTGLEERYGILDNANVRWNNVFDLPLSICAGRQDVQFGDPLNWWLVADGTPYDGSWTVFLDSIRLTYVADEIQTRLDLVYLYQNALPDAWIPTLGRSSENRNPSASVHGSAPYWLTEQNEQGVILYAANKSVKNTEIDGYFIYKGDRQENLIRSPYNTPLGDSADIYTIGGKISGKPLEHWQYSAEGAYQFGRKRDPMLVHDDLGASVNRTIDAFGANASLAYDFNDAHKNQASLAFEYLSGDDPSTTGKDEMFDILWGRWPRWSELYIYSYPNETGGKFAQFNNILRVGPSWSLTPFKDTTFSATYNALFSPEETPTRALDATLFNHGNFRGHYVQTVLKHQFNKHVSALFWGELVWMGDYYSHHDLMSFLRGEMIFTF